MAMFLGNDGRVYDHDPGGGICLDGNPPPAGRPRPCPQVPQPQTPRPRPQTAQPQPPHPQPRMRPREQPRPTLPVHRVSWQRKFWYWFLTLGGAVLLSIGVYVMFRDALFSAGETETLADLLHRLVSALAPFLVVAGGVLPTWGYGSYAADLYNYNLHAFFWAGITCIFSLTVTVFLLAILPPVGAFAIQVALILFGIRIIWEIITG